LSREELEAAHAKDRQKRIAAYGTTDIAGALDAAGERNTSTNVSNGTNNTSTNVSNGTNNNATVSSSTRIALALQRAEEQRRRFREIDTNGDGKWSPAELKAAEERDRQKRIAKYGTDNIAALLDSGGKLNTSTDVSDMPNVYRDLLLSDSPQNVFNGTNNTFTDFSDMMDAYDAKLIRDLLLSDSPQNVSNGTLNNTLPLQTTLARNGEAIYQGSNEVSNLMNGGTTIIAPTNVSDNSVKNTTTTTMSGSSNVRTTDDSLRAFNSNPYM